MLGRVHSRRNIRACNLLWIKSDCGYKEELLVFYLFCVFIIKKNKEFLLPRCTILSWLNANRVYILRYHDVIVMLKQTDVMVATAYHCYTSKLPIICSLQISIIYNKWKDAIRLPNSIRSKLNKTFLPDKFSLWVVLQ